MRAAPVLFALTLLLVPLTSSGQPTGVPAPDVYAHAPEPDVSVPATPEAPKAEPEAPKAEPAVPDAKKAEPKVVDPIPEPKDMGEAMEDVGLMIEAAKNGNWVLFAGILILLLIYLLDKVVNIKQWIPKKAIPWVAAGFGIVVSIAMQLTTGIPWGQALLQGLCAGLVATGFWELVFQHVLKSKEPAEKG